jgi:3-hydroxypropanoate dehydrogenase
MEWTEHDRAAQAAAARLKEEVTHADPATLRLLFTEARTHNGWQDRPVPDTLLEQLYDLLKWPPTSANAQPGRFIFLRTREAKARLKPHLSPGNVEKTMAAPVVVIVAYDVAFWKELPRLFPLRDMSGPFKENAAAAETFAFRNGTLQGAYLILAARALGLDCGPMSGFDNEGVDAEFLAGTSVRSNFLVNLGYADTTKIWARLPRLDFAEACMLL